MIAMFDDDIKLRSGYPSKFADRAYSADEGCYETYQYFFIDYK